MISSISCPACNCGKNCFWQLDILVERWHAFKKATTTPTTYCVRVPSDAAMHKSKFSINGHCDIRIHSVPPHLPSCRRAAAKKPLLLGLLVKEATFYCRQCRSLRLPLQIAFPAPSSGHRHSRLAQSCFRPLLSCLLQAVIQQCSGTVWSCSNGQRCCSAASCRAAGFAGLQGLQLLNQAVEWWGSSTKHKKKPISINRESDRDVVGRQRSEVTCRKTTLKTL